VVQVAVTSINETIGAVRAPIAADLTIHFTEPTHYAKIASQIAAVPNVARVEREGGTNATTNWGTLQVSGYEPDTQLYHYQLTSGRWMRPGDVHVVLLSPAALQRTGLHLGDTITLTNTYGPRTQLPLTIIGTVEQSIDVLGWIGAAVVPVNTLYELTGTSATQVEANTNEVIVEANDRSPEAVMQLVRQLAPIVNPGGFSDDGTGYISGSDGTLDTFLEYTLRRQSDAYILYYLLYALALIVGTVGVLGLANTLAASVLERRREIGLLRALGASGWRVAQVFWVESLALGGIAWCAAVVVGVPLAYVFVQSFAREAMPVDFYVNPTAVALLLGAVLLIATLASIGPAWRAGRARAADLLRYE
jgi:putative ABC transport system permease protein